MSAEKDYILGTHDEEIARLGLQHQVWRPHMLAAWMRGGMTRGSKVVDIGAGPGYATLDAAEIVGPKGQVIAVERSGQFLEFARRQAEQRALAWVSFQQADLVEDDLQLAGFDLAWCRWVASFVSSPQRLVERLAAALRVGGKAVLHEYAHYATWRVVPRNDRFESFVEEVMASWRATGGEPDIAAVLVPLLASAGFEIIGLRPLIFAVRPTDFMWRWPAAFIASNPPRLVELGRVQSAWAEALQKEFDALGENPNAVILTPLVLEIIAEKR